MHAFNSQFQHLKYLALGSFYTQIKKTVNPENIAGMCVLTNHMQDLVTTENEWVLSHRIELFRKTTRFNLHQFILQKLEVLFLQFYLRAPRTTQAKIGLSSFVL